MSFGDYSAPPKSESEIEASFEDCFKYGASDVEMLDSSFTNDFTSVDSYNEGIFDILCPIFDLSGQQQFNALFDNCSWPHLESSIASTSRINNTGYIRPGECYEEDILWTDEEKGTFNVQSGHATGNEIVAQEQGKELIHKGKNSYKEKDVLETSGLQSNNVSGEKKVIELKETTQGSGEEITEESGELTFNAQKSEAGISSIAAKSPSPRSRSSSSTNNSLLSTAPSSPFSFSSSKFKDSLDFAAFANSQKLDMSLELSQLNFPAHITNSVIPCDTYDPDYEHLQFRESFLQFGFQNSANLAINSFFIDEVKEEFVEAFASVSEQEQKGEHSKVAAMANNAETEKNAITEISETLAIDDFERNCFGLQVECNFNNDNDAPSNFTEPPDYERFNGFEAQIIPFEKLDSMKMNSEINSAFEKKVLESTGNVCEPDSGIFPELSSTPIINLPNTPSKVFQESWNNSSPLIENGLFSVSIPEAQTVKKEKGNLPILNALTDAKIRQIMQLHQTQRLTNRNNDKLKDKFKVCKPDRIKKTKREKRCFEYFNIHIPHTIVPARELQNRARNPIIRSVEFKSKLLELLNQQDCVINRTRYHRGNIDRLRDLHPNVLYEKNPVFDISHPYQQEFTRVELDPQTGAPIMETRSALCSYCEELSFYELKNSCYSQHMSHSHGIYTDDYLTPNPLYIGRYQVAKKSSASRKTKPRIRCHEGVVCPACYEVVEIRCWSSTSEKKPLSNYLRHFKEHHRVDKRRDSFFSFHT